MPTGETIEMRKSFVIASFALLMVTAVGLIYFNFSSPPKLKEFKVRLTSPGNGDGYVTAILNCSLPKVPNTLLVPKVVSHNYTDIEAKAIAMQVFDVEGELEVSWTAYGSVLVTNGSQELEL